VFVDWAAARVLTVEVNGKAVDSELLWAMPGGAEEAVQWPSGDFRRFGVSLMPGDIVLTGTPLGLHPVRPGDYVAILIDGTTSVLCNVA
jgi:2-keto-4-pentenoate hydratase/2-oxohepta-3-ene-1,7-dioic acid hydratase in catechol pathway